MARLDVLIFRLRFYHVLTSYTADCNGPKFLKTLMFLDQAGTFLSYKARRSSAKRSSTSDLTVYILLTRTTLVRATSVSELCEKLARKVSEIVFLVPGLAWVSAPLPPAHR